jgi:hypothetical protein
LAVAAVVVLTYRRLFYGIDFTDESFYVVQPYRLVLGARPFVDETSVTQQTAAILLYPLVGAYHAVAGLTGIVLYVRELQFALSLLVATGLVVSLRHMLDVPRAALVAASVVPFVPFDIHSVSYNTLACGLFTAGCLLGVHATGSPRSRRFAFAAAAICLGLAAFAYPPLVGAVAVAASVWIALAHGARRRAAGWAVVALALPTAGLAALVGSAGPRLVAADYRNSSRYLGQAGGFVPEPRPATQLVRSRARRSQHSGLRRRVDAAPPPGSRARRAGDVRLSRCAARQLPARLPRPRP